MQINTSARITLDFRIVSSLIWFNNFLMPFMVDRLLYEDMTQHQPDAVDWINPPFAESDKALAVWKCDGTDSAKQLSRFDSANVAHRSGRE